MSKINKRSYKKSKEYKIKYNFHFYRKLVNAFNIKFNDKLTEFQNKGWKYSNAPTRNKSNIRKELINIETISELLTRQYQNICERQ